MVNMTINLHAITTSLMRRGLCGKPWRSPRTVINGVGWILLGLTPDEEPRDAGKRLLEGPQFPISVV